MKKPFGFSSIGGNLQESVSTLWKHVHWTVPLLFGESIVHMWQLWGAGWSLFQQGLVSFIVCVLPPWFHMVQIWWKQCSVLNIHVISILALHPAHILVHPCGQKYIVPHTKIFISRSLHTHPLCEQNTTLAQHSWDFSSVLRFTISLKQIDMLTTSQLVPVGKAISASITHLGYVIEAVQTRRTGKLVLFTFYNNRSTPMTI